MAGRVTVIWERIRGSYWFIPAGMAFAAAVLSLAMIELDKNIESERIGRLRWVVETGADGARALLQTIAGSMITVAGTVFSITIIALSLASQQFGPRLLRNFMRDRGNQIVLGTFTATFLYCILILRTVSGREDAAFIPHGSIIIAVLLAMASVGVLIYFIHHVAISIQAPYIIANVARELEEQIDELFPENVGDPSGPEQDLSTILPADTPSTLVCFDASGYVQNIDEPGMMQTATELDLILRIRFRPGAFAMQGEPCLEVWPAERLNDQTAARLRALFTLGPSRTAEQDVSFAIDQLVEVAARALSPSLNDPYTAISCIDRLGEAFSRLATRRIPSPARFDSQGRLRVIAEPFRLVDLVLQSVEPLRQYGASHLLVALRLIDTLATAAPFVRREEDQQIMLREIERIRSSAEHAHQGDPQRQRIADRARRAREAILRRKPLDRQTSGNPMH
jgi:uncharacterized membrane protein